MADIARPEISPSPSKVGRILSSIGKFTVDSTLADFLSGINGRKKVQQKVKGRPLPLRSSSNSNKSHGDIEGIVHDIRQVVKTGCGKSLGGSEPCKEMPREVPKEENHSGNRVFIRSRL